MPTKGLNFILTQAEPAMLARLLHECIRESVAKYTEWDQLDEGTRKVFMVQADTLLATYSIADPDDVVELDESLDGARRDCIASQQESLMLRHALGEVVGHLGALETVLGLAISNESKAPHRDYEERQANVSWLEHELKAHGEYAAVVQAAINAYDAPRTASCVPVADVAGDALDTSWGPL